MEIGAVTDRQIEPLPHDRHEVESGRVRDRSRGNAAIGAACAGKATPATIYELGGPDIVTLRELLDKTQAWSGHTRRYVRMPFWFAKLVALATLPLPNSLRPLTVDQVRMLQRPNVVSDAARQEGRTLAALGIAQPQSLAAVVPGYLERFQPHGQFAHYRG